MLEKILFIKRFIDNHPIASRAKLKCYLRVLNWQLSQAISPGLKRKQFVENSYLMLKKGLAGATSHIYAGLGEYEEMGFLLHLLRKEDYFGDIGSNIGAFSVLATVNCGAEAVAVEPVPNTFSILKSNVEVNNVGNRIKILQNGVGDKETTLRFTSVLDALNHVIQDHEESSDAIEVAVLPMDKIFEHRTPTLLKIDVEGYEFPALLGAQRLLSDPSLKAIIIELNGCGAGFGFDENEIHRMLIEKGFYRMVYHPMERQLIPDAVGKNDNKIYVRDIDWVQNRIATARKFKILNSYI
jgi:FkbM family methyltransferase